MNFAILIHGEEGVYERLPEETQKAILAGHGAMQEQTKAEGKLGPVARLMGPSTSMHMVREGDQIVVTDGPFAETKEQLLGFYIVNTETIEEAVEIAKRLPLGSGGIEVRPIAWLNDPSGDLKD